MRQSLAADRLGEAARLRYPVSARMEVELESCRGDEAADIEGH